MRWTNCGTPPIRPHRHGLVADPAVELARQGPGETSMPSKKSLRENCDIGVVSDILRQCHGGWGGVQGCCQLPSTFFSLQFGVSCNVFPKVNPLCCVFLLKSRAAPHQEIPWEVTWNVMQVDFKCCNLASRPLPECVCSASRCLFSVKKGPFRFILPFYSKNKPAPPMSKCDIYVKM